MQWIFILIFPEKLLFLIVDLLVDGCTGWILPYDKFKVYKIFVFYQFEIVDEDVSKEKSGTTLQVSHIWPYKAFLSH